MVDKKTLLATLGGFVTLFVLGYVIYELALGDFFQANSKMGEMMRETPMMAMIALGDLLAAFIMAIMFKKWTRGVNNAKQGYIFGALIGLIVFSIAIINYGVMDNFNATSLVVDGLVAVFARYGLAGLVIAMIYGKAAEA